MEVDEGSDQKSGVYPHWMAAHARLKNEFTEGEKCHNLMSWLICLPEKKLFTWLSTRFGGIKEAYHYDRIHFFYQKRVGLWVLVIPGHRYRLFIYLFIYLCIY